jgi:hypothetical protein
MLEIDFFSTRLIDPYPNPSTIICVFFVSRAVKDEERAKKRANDEWRLRRKVESEQKLAARVQADEATVRRKTEFAAASKFEQQQRYAFGV